MVGPASLDMSARALQADEQRGRESPQGGRIEFHASRTARIFPDCVLAKKFWLVTMEKIHGSLEGAVRRAADTFLML